MQGFSKKYLKKKEENSRIKDAYDIDVESEYID